ncbi:MAG TPA: heparin lyase I family protein [Chloroflexota bacterium]|jgi:hypothetical protein
MTRLLTCGWETGDVNEAGTSTIGGNTTLTVVSTTPTPRAGTFCLKYAQIASGAALTYKSFVLPAPKTDVWVRFAFYAHATNSTEEAIAQWLESTGQQQTQLSWSATDGLLRIYRAPGSLASGGSIASSNAACPPDSWHVIEWRTQITSATSGTSELWLDGSQVINVSGVDNTASSTLNVQVLQVGLTLLSGVAPTTGTYYAYDDLAVNDTNGTLNNGRPGDGRVILLTPSGAGSSTVLTRGGTDSGANWSQVDEVPPSMSDYVMSANVGDRDLYAMTDVPAGFSINVVEAIALAQNSDAGAGSLAPTLKSGATTSEAAAAALGTSANYVVSRWETDPNTGAAWTSAAVNAVEAGVTVR